MGKRANRDQILHKGLTLLICILLNIDSFSQSTFFYDNFNDTVKHYSWYDNYAYTTSPYDSSLKISINKKDPYTSLLLYTQMRNIQSRPYVCFKVKSDTAFLLRVYLMTNDENMSAYIENYVGKSSGFQTLAFDFSGNMGTNQPTNINYLKFVFNPGTSFSGNVYFDDLSMGDSAATPQSICNGNAAKLDTVRIAISTDSMKALDAAPYTAIVHGSFTDGNGIVYNNIELSYRGAYALLGMLYEGPQRHWKIKFSKSQKYRNEREWNFNYNMSVREKFAYDLLETVGVKAPQTRSVILYVNGARHGIYLEFDDPDNKEFLTRSYNDPTGDLYKAATDLPNQPAYFAGLNFLGNHDNDYYKHYQKKTNNNNLDSLDYSSIRKFIQYLTFAPNDQFVDILNMYFDTKSFIRYLVVSNFMSNWDGYPQRPKNYWMYNRLVDNKWFFIPWDMTGTFELTTHTCDAMGADVSVFYAFDGQVPTCLGPTEDTMKLLVRRMMKYAEFRNAYMLEYKSALKTYLSPDFLRHRLDSVSNVIACNCMFSEFFKYRSTIEQVKTFIDYKAGFAMSQLNSTKLWDTVPVTDYFPPDTLPHSLKDISGFDLVSVSPNPFSEHTRLTIFAETNGPVNFSFYDITGTLVLDIRKELQSGYSDLEIGEELPSGMFIVKINTTQSSMQGKIVKY